MDLVYKIPLQAPTEEGVQVVIARMTARKAEKIRFVGRLCSQVNYLLSGHN